MNPSDEQSEAWNEETDPKSPGRLIDELIDYIRARQGPKKGEVRHPIDQERLLRAAVRQLRKNPIPAALLGVSVIWLLLAENGADDDTPPGWGQQFEEEMVGQLKGGYEYTGSRLQEAVDRHPWAATAALIAGGLGAAFFIPKRSHGRPMDPDDEDLMSEEFMTEDPILGEDDEMESSEDDYEDRPGG